jgi:DNA polymerase III epsilon subunit-like protein
MYLVLDTETTGVEPTDRIVSMAWAVYDETGIEVVLTHCFVIPDGFTIPRDATAIHGITTEEARRKGEPISTVLTKLNDDIKERAPKLFVGHNVGFDRAIVLNEYARLKSRPDLSRLPTYCTMKSTVEFCGIPRYVGGFKWPSLQDLHRKLFGGPVALAHDAQVDVRTCAKCFFELRRRGWVNV